MFTYYTQGATGIGTRRTSWFNRGDGTTSSKFSVTTNPNATASNSFKKGRHTTQSLS